ncbi:hypothetical protein [Pseudonocardia sp. GCM10023141]|uniref:hypothetical protein n=1 Tax=Pseudonocardia sp. GCM10023141 TaxID=3252653 RepID=UPI00361ECF2A
MPDQNPSLPGISPEILSADALSAELPETPPAPAPVNRAERRGKAQKHDSTELRHQGSGRHARPAQGRRINPVRRTG